MSEPTPGSLLVATPSLVDPSFRRTVVLLLAHGADGTLGVVLNRPTETAVQQILPAWQSLVSRPRIVFHGGPVAVNSAICVGVRRSGSSATPGSAADQVDALLDPVGPPLARVSGELVLVDLDAEPESTMALLRGARIFAGHAGWSPGQLDAELEQHSWYVMPAESEDLLAARHTDLWFRVLRRQGLPLALEAYQPREASLN